MWRYFGIVVLVVELAHQDDDERAEKDGQYGEEQPPVVHHP